ncbi:g2511 [Coccomyxa viridis]|uniref:G2511 protein n=1 Tax=Coccomyxa viridis TaxID=1274662 RepID=A0ABP1FMU0_9CHLO
MSNYLRSWCQASKPTASKDICISTKQWFRRQSERWRSVCKSDSRREAHSLACRGSARHASPAPPQQSDDEWYDEDLQPVREAQSTSAAGRQHASMQGSFELPKPTNVRVKKAAYVKSSVSLEQCPKPKLPEFAVIGRSNVGKSSLINMLTGQGALAKVSKTPGKTICINHFLINDSWYLVDLPGYGYAQRSKASRLEWSAFTKEYFLKRETLANVLLLVDSSIPVQEADVECASWLADAQVPFSLVFTKTDKRKKGIPGPQQNIEAFQAALLRDFESLPAVFHTDSEELLKEWDEVPAVFITSSREGEGRQQLMHYIAQLRMLFTGEAMPNMKMLTVAPVEEEADVPDVETVEHIPYPSQRSDQAVPN